MNAKKIITPVVMLVVVASLFTVGTAYALAHYGGVDITDNSTEEVYATLSPEDDAMFSDIFSKKIYYDTHISYTTQKVTQYYLADGQTENITVGGNAVTAIPLGTLILLLEQFGDTQAFDLFIQKIAGTMNGTFYIGYATSTDGQSYGAMSYVPFTALGTTISNLASSVAYLKIILFVDSSFHTAGATSMTAPLVDVSFLFRADILQ